MHVIGTAGHVDHGKSTLVHALTGIDPDRLAEEKAREMTIDLGFAWLMLDGEEVGIIDVPGHRDFIENMLAGVGGIDLALFVVAADEGVMPQTREHLAILDLLAINRSVIALTKTDLIDDPDWLELVALEVSDAFQGTALAGAPIIPVSARTGTGLAELKSVLAKALAAAGPSIDLGRPRLPIDRVFTLSGFGTVVTGTLIDGVLRVGDEVEIQPGGPAGRIRGLQTHRTKRDVAHPGSRVAVNLSGVDRDQLRRGQVVVRRGAFRPTHLLDLQYRQLADAGAPLEHNDEVKLFIGAAEVTGHARIIGREQLSPGETGWVQVALSSPVVAVRGDRFILRRPSPGATLGGGHVLDPQPGRRHRRLRPETVERFRTLAQGTPEELLLRTLAPVGVLPAGTLLERTGLPVEASRPALQQLVDAGQIKAIDKTVVAMSHWQLLRERATTILSQYHADTPLRPGMDREELRSGLQISPPLFNTLQAELIAAGTIVESGATLRLPYHQVSFSAEQERAIQQLFARFESQGVNSPSVKECKAIVGESVYIALVDLGRVCPVSEEVVYSEELYRELIDRLRALLETQGAITAAEAREHLGTSRKYAIALLEHLDERRITRRIGDKRELLRPTRASN